MKRPQHSITQASALEWIAEAHAMSEATSASLGDPERREFAAKMRRVLARVACDPSRISARGHVVADAGRANWEEGAIYDLARRPHGKGTGARTRLFDDIVGRYFAEEYAGETVPPADLIHVTCTGYASPSGAQRLVADRGWGASSRVTHAYHMGCYAAFPALRMASGFVAAASATGTGDASRVDIVHTELCSLHFDPADHSVEQLVVQSLFGDGFIRYAVTRDPPRAPCLRMLALSETILPESAQSMGWLVADHGMTMTLARDVPARIGGALHAFVLDLYARAGLDAREEMPRTVFAVHPGGPKIIDAVRDRLEIDDAQVATSRAVLFDYGNMSSATLPHVWMRILEDSATRDGTIVVSLAFGPGLTVCGGVFRKQLA